MQPTASTLIAGAAVIIFAIATVLAFGWFGSKPGLDAGEVGLIPLGLGLGFASLAGRPR